MPGGAARSASPASPSGRNEASGASTRSQPAISAATRPSASSSGSEAFTWQCHTTLRPSSHGARPTAPGSCSTTTSWSPSIASATRAQAPA